MSRLKTFTRQFSWKMVLIRIVVNAAALLLTALILPDIYFADHSFRSIVIIAIGLGILNAIVKPVILLLTGQLIFVTFGLLVILVNTVILWLLERFFPGTLVVNSLFWAFVGGALLGLFSNALENLLGLTPPILPDEERELRKRIEAEQVPTLLTMAIKPQAVVQHDVETQSVSDLMAAQAALDTLSSSAGPGRTASPQEADIEATPQEAGAQAPEDQEAQVREIEAQAAEAEDQPDTHSGGAA